MATRNLSQYPRKFSKALQPRLHSRRHPTGKRHRRLRSFLHSVAFPALWVFFFFFSEQRSSAGPATRSPSVRATALAPAAGDAGHPEPGSPAPRLPPQRLGRSGPRRLDGLARPWASRGLVARGRAGRRRRLRVRGSTASAILAAAAAAVSASSCVFAGRCRFPRPRRQGGDTGARGRKRKEEKGVESGGGRSLSVEAASERGGEAEKAPRQPLPRRRPAPAASVLLAAPAPRPCRGLAGAEERRLLAVLRGLLGPVARPSARNAPSRRLFLRRARGPLRRQHGGREDLQQRGSYRNPASPPGPGPGPGLACRARARAARSSPGWGDGDWAAVGEGNGPRPSRGLAGLREGRGRAGPRGGRTTLPGGFHRGQSPPRHPRTPRARAARVALQGLNCCRTSLRGSSRAGD